MRHFIIFSIILTSLSKSSFGQSALITVFPKVDVTVQLLKNRFKSFESIQFIMTITNRSDTIQSLLFDKPFKSYPWGTFVVISKDGDTISANVNREILSSTLYSENDLKAKGAFYNLRPRDSLKHMYLLADVVILKDYQLHLKNGEYNFSLSYYGNQSNQVTFNIDQ
jgi:hypothetical protein